jgi:hypothetical protein
MILTPDWRNSQTASLRVEAAVGVWYHGLLQLARMQFGCFANQNVAADHAIQKNIGCAAKRQWGIGERSVNSIHGTINSLINVTAISTGG